MNADQPRGLVTSRVPNTTRSDILTSESHWLSATRAARTRENRVLRESLLTGLKLWGVRRVQVRTIAGVVGGVLLVALLGLFNWVAGVVALAGLGAAALLQRRQPVATPTEPVGPGWAFGGERLPFRSISEVLELKPREVVRRLAARYRPEHQVEMVLWLVASDGTGQPWTLVQDRFGGQVPSITASAVGLVDGACDPYLEAQRLARTETGVALSDVVVIGWGTDSSLDARRDVILVIGRTDAATALLSTHTYEGGGRRSHMVQLHPDSVSRSLTTVDARRWQAGAIRGLVSTLDVLYPGSGPLLEELVAEPWRVRRMFGRVGRLTDHPAETDVEVGPVVLKVVDGEITEEPEYREPIKHDRALNWEGTSRAIPTRYR